MSFVSFGSPPYELPHLVTLKNYPSVRHLSTATKGRSGEVVHARLALHYSASFFIVERIDARYAQFPQGKLLLKDIRPSYNFCSWPLSDGGRWLAVPDTSAIKVA